MRFFSLGRALLCCLLAVCLGLAFAPDAAAGCGGNARAGLFAGKVQAALAAGHQRRVQNRQDRRHQRQDRRHNRRSAVSGANARTAATAPYAAAGRAPATPPPR